MSVQIEALEEAAVAATGLDDFGAASYRRGLATLVESLDAQADLSDLGVAALKAQIVGALSNRLRVVGWRHGHPEVAGERVEAPLVVVGMPRTGTTLLGGLLGCDPARRALRRWEVNDCIPPPEAATFTTDPRIEATREASGMLDSLNPGFKAIHHEAPEDPTECVTLLAQDFTSLLWETLANVPAYGEWLLAADQAAAYAYHRDVLQVLQSHAPGRWSLKSPHHGLALDALFDRYPDARVVVTHRDPVTVIASLCSLVQSLSSTFSDADHTAYIARHWPDVAEAIVTRIGAYRDEHGDRSFLDVRYHDLVADPIAVVHAIYAWEGTPLDPTVQTAMRRFLAGHAQGRFGRHAYSLEAFGLTPEAVADRFRPYSERYGVTNVDRADR